MPVAREVHATKFGDIDDRPIELLVVGRAITSVVTRRRFGDLLRLDMAAFLLVLDRSASSPNVVGNGGSAQKCAYRAD